MTRSLYKKARISKLRKLSSFMQNMRMRQLQAESYHPCSDNEHKCSHAGHIQTVCRDHHHSD